MSDQLQEKCLEFELNLANAQLKFGSDSIEVAAALEQYAEFLRSRKMRLLEAANMEARARVIRRDYKMPTMPATISQSAVQSRGAPTQSHTGLCTKCGAPTERGVSCVQGVQLVWFASTQTPPVAGAIMPITGVRCTRCGFLEFYASQ